VITEVEQPVRENYFGPEVVASNLTGRTNTLMCYWAVLLRSGRNRLAFWCIGFCVAGRFLSGSQVTGSCLCSHRGLLKAIHGFGIKASLAENYLEVMSSQFSSLP